MPDLEFEPYGLTSKEPTHYVLDYDDFNLYRKYGNYTLLYRVALNRIKNCVKSKQDPCTELNNSHKDLLVRLLPHSTY